MPILRLAPRRLFVGAAATAALVAVFCLYLLTRDPGLFFNDDYQISILPVFTDIARSWGEGHWPLLSPYSWACANLAGEYQYGTFSVFINLLVVLVWKLPLGFAQQAAALSVTHLAVLAAGAYLLARERRLPGVLAAGVGVIAALNGWIMGWGAIDWFGALAAEAWLPWCWWAFEVALRGRRGGVAWRERLRFLLPVPFVYLLLTAGFPYTVVMLALLTVWLAARTWFRPGHGWRRCLPLVTGWGLGLLLSAPAWLSLLAAIHGSHRSTEGVGVGSVAWSVPLTSLPALILPNWTVPWADFANVPVPHASLELAGGFVPVAGLLTALVCLRGRLVRVLRWELGLAGVVLLLCLLPSPGLFRWSFRWLPLFHLILALTAGRALHLLASRTRRRAWTSNAGVWASVLAALAWLAIVIFHLQYRRYPMTDAMPPFTLGVAVAWATLAAWPGRRGWSLTVAGLAVFAAMAGTYRFMPTNPHLPIYPMPAGLSRVEPLSADRLYLSFYREADQYYRDWQTPKGFGSLVRMGSTGMIAGVRMINGYSPIMPPGAGKVLNIETHGNVPDPTGEALIEEDAAVSGGLLDELGVDGLVITHDYKLAAKPSPAKWEEILNVNEGSVYHRRGGPVSEIREVNLLPPDAEAKSPQTRFRQRRFERMEPGTETKVRLVENSRLRVVAEVEVPGNRKNAVTLSFRRPYFTGYHATLDGKTLAVFSQDGLMPAVTLPPGSRGRLTLRYLPRAVVWGAILAVVGAVATGALAWRALTRAG